MPSTYAYFFDHWCCLNIDEKSSLRSAALWFTATAGSPIDLISWNGMWLGTTKSRIPRMKAAVALYYLEESDDDCDPNPLSPCVRFRDPIFWLEMSVFILTPAVLCPDPCPKIIFP